MPHFTALSPLTGAVLVSACLFPLNALAQAVATPPVKQLDAIVATATGSEQDLRNAPAAISVITAQDLRDRPVRNLADALQGVPGVTLKGIGINRKGVSIRGMDSNYTLVLVNGRRINPSINAIAHSNLDLGWIPTDQIERIEVIRGPMSSLYGSEALGGTINIITKGKRDEWSGELSTYLTHATNDLAADGTMFSASLAGPLIKDKLYLNLSGETQYSGEVRMPHGVQTLRPSYLEGKRSHQVNLGIDWLITPEHELSLQHISGQDESRRHVLTTKVKRQPNRRPIQYQELYNTVDEFNREQSSLSYKGQWSWGQTQASLYHSNLKRKNQRSDIDEITRQKLQETVADVSAHIPIGEQHLISLGGEWRDESLYDQGFRGAGKASLTHKAVYIQDEFTVMPNWILTAGTRLDHHEKFGAHYSPRLYSVFHLSDNLTLKGGIGRGFKAPTLKQLSPNYQSAGRAGFFTIHGNPDLRPETSTNYELSLLYETERLYLEGTVFHNRLKNKIAYHCIDFCGQRGLEQGTYQNIERAKYRGAELGASYALTDSLKMKLSYTYLDARDHQHNIITKTPRHTGTLGLTWQANEQLSLGAQMHYIGSQYLASSTGKAKHRASQVYALQAAYQLNKHLRVSASVDNLTNEKFIDENTVNTYAEPGRRVNLGLTLSY
ncbi:MAG: TonB-dependent receptor [Pelistega sp.]|nr:TonB-dependent receptor [Pelistega sp.]